METLQTTAIKYTEFINNVKSDIFFNTTVDFKQDKNSVLVSIIGVCRTFNKNKQIAIEASILFGCMN